MADDIFPKKYSFSCGLICHSLQGKEKAGLKLQSLQPSIKKPLKHLEQDPNKKTMHNFSLTKFKIQS